MRGYAKNTSYEIKEQSKESIVDFTVYLFIIFPKLMVYNTFVKT